MPSFFHKPDDRPWVKVVANALQYQLVKSFHVAKNLVLRRDTHHYLFILSPPFCGSTLLTKTISSSPSVSVNNPFGTNEGQRLPEVRKRMFETKLRWDEDYRLNWDRIKTIWLKYWDLNKPVLLEKSPPNLVRASRLSKHFWPSYFIVFIRNPYAHCESLMRRRKVSAKEAAEFSIDCLESQKKNLEVLDNAILITYEEFTDAPSETIERIENFVPSLERIDLTTDKDVHSHIEVEGDIVNLNPKKIQNIKPAELSEINKVFSAKIDVLKAFQYDLLTT